MTSEYAGLRTFIAMLRILFEINYCTAQVWSGYTLRRQLRKLKTKDRIALLPAGIWRLRWKHDVAMVRIDSTSC